MSRDPKLDMDFAQTMRINQINQLTKHGEQLPTDPKEIALLASLLKDVEGGAASVIKLKIDEKAVDAASETAANVREIFRTLGNDPFRVEKPVEATVVSRVTELARSVVLPEIEIVEGMTRQGVEELNYDDFVSSPE